MTDYNPVYSTYYYQCYICRKRWHSKEKGYGNKKSNPLTGFACGDCTKIANKRYEGIVVKLIHLRDEINNILRGKIK